MASGKKSRAKRRTATPPPVRSKSPPRRRQASPRVLALAAVVVVTVAIVIAAVVGFGSTGGKDTSNAKVPTAGSLAGALPGASEVNALFKGIPQRGLTLGMPSAPVTLVEYIDLQCPFCRQLETEAIPQVVRRYVRTGKVKIEARVLAFIGPDSGRGRDAMIAAGRQGKAFNFAQLLYDNQGTENTGWLSDNMVEQAAKSIPGANPRQLVSERSSRAVDQRGTAIDRQATADNVSATPTLLVGKTGGKLTQVRLTSPSDLRTLARAIDTALA